MEGVYCKLVSWGLDWTRSSKVSQKGAEARKTTILQPVDQKPQLQKDREDEKAEGYVPDEGTRKNPRKTTK